MHLDVEIQQRAVEYDQLFLLDSDTRNGLLEKMPVLESAIQGESLKGTGQPSTSSNASTNPASSILGTDISSSAKGKQQVFIA